MDAFINMFYSLVNGIPNVLFALILLAIAFLAAWLVRVLVDKLLKLVKLEKLPKKLNIGEETAKKIKTFISKLAYFVTFLLFLPSVLDKLGLHSVSSPISNLVNMAIGIIPDLVVAAIIVCVGVFVAGLVKDLLLAVLKAVKVDKLQEKAGIKVEQKNTLSNVIVNVIYGLIVLLVITAALDKLGIGAIAEPARYVVSAVFAVIPKVIGAIVVIGIGIMIAKLAAGALESLLAGVGADSLVAKITGDESKKVALSKWIGTAVKYVIVAVFLVQGVNMLQLPVLTEIGGLVLGYVPTVISAVLILAAGIFAGNLAESALLKKFPAAKGSAMAAKVVILVVTAFLCFSQLNLAAEIVNTTFILVVAAVCVAFALAVGIGGRGFAANMLQKLENKLCDSNKEEDK